MKRTLAILGLWLCSCVSTGESVDPFADPDEGAARVVTKLYDHVTFEAGTSPDWAAVRRLFIDEAVIVLRTGRDEMTVFSLDGFVDDFERFIERANVRATGFTERILDLRAETFGDIAHVKVLFDAHIPGSSRPPSAGIDSFELFRRDGTWRIVSIVNERPTVENPLPASLD